MALTLVTGSHGFIGTAVRAQLPGEVITLDIGEPRVHKRAVHPTIHGPCGVFDAEHDPTPDVVIHLAAQVGVADSADDPERYFEENSVDTALFLQELAKARPRRLIVASSMSVYGAGGSNIAEGAPAIPESIYGLTKYDQERLCCIWGKRYNVPVIALRFFNVYGPGQALHNPYTGVLANFANWLLHDEQPRVYEDGQQTRDFIHVDDVASAVVGCLSPRVGAGVYNVCTGRATSIERAAKLLAKALGKSIEPKILGEWRPGDVRHAVGNNMKLRTVLPNWQPRPFDAGVQEYAAWLMSR